MRVAAQTTTMSERQDVVARVKSALVDYREQQAADFTHLLGEHMTWLQELVPELQAMLPKYEEQGERNEET